MYPRPKTHIIDPQLEKKMFEWLILRPRKPFDGQNWGELMPDVENGKGGG